MKTALEDMVPISISQHCNDVEMGLMVIVMLGIMVMVMMMMMMMMTICR